MARRLVSYFNLL